MMSNTKRYLGLTAIMAATFAIALAVIYATPAHANPSTLQRSLTCVNNAGTTVVTSGATSTVVYMTPGNATTTCTLLNSTGNIAYDSAQVNVQVTATSTGVIGAVGLRARVEVSYDADAADWYPISVVPTSSAGLIQGFSTTTPLTTDPYLSYSMVLSTSTTPAGSFGGTGNSTRMNRSFTIGDVPLKHIRVVFTNPTGGGNYGLYAEVVGKKQNP